MALKENTGIDALLATLGNEEFHTPRGDVVRLAVRLRARDACEYCLRPTDGIFHVSHIIPPSRWPDYLARRLRVVPPLLGRSGPDHIDNFAWCCADCNFAKGDHIDGRAGTAVHRLYDPRRDRWRDHFAFGDGDLHIVGISPVGQATEHVLAFNDPRPNGPVAVRHLFGRLGQYPPVWARGWQLTEE